MAASWECPSLPMLSLSLKESEQTSFLGIKPMISAHYEEDPNSFHEEIKQLDALRQNALRPPKDYNGVSILRHYFAQLHLIRERFPPETIGQLPIDFAWKDAFTDTQYVQDGLQIEQASILYNISALHSILGCRVKRSSEQEMKESVTHFQCAAGAFSYLDDNFAVNHASRDLTVQFISLYKNLMLGQAQECFVEKSLKGTSKVKNLTVAKIAARVSEYYQIVLRHLESDPCNIIAKKHKEWPKLIKMKIFYFQALSHFFQGGHAEEMGKHGEQLAWYQLSVQKLNSIGKIHKSVGEGVREAAKNFYDQVNERFQACKLQNDQVYHETITNLETLELTQGADLVKPVVFQPTDPKNLGKDIFARLVPMRAYEAASVYSEEKAKLLRSVTSSVSEKDEELEQFLLSLNVEEISKLHEAAPSIPDDVLHQQKLLEGKSSTIKKLYSDVQELIKLSNEVDQDFSLIAEERAKDEEEEANFQNHVRERPPSQICVSLWKETDNFSKYHTQASKSNAELKIMFEVHYRYLLLLSGPIASLRAAMPKMTPMDAPAEDTAQSQQWKMLMDKVEQMREQRKHLVNQLRDQINSDDITKNLIGHLGSDKETFIDEKMKTHRDIADIIRQNLTAQNNILLAVTEANAKKVQIRQAVQELTQQQESMSASLVKAGSSFPLLQSKISEGLTFYSRLHGNVVKLRGKILEVMTTRNRERGTIERRRTPERSVSPAPDHVTTGRTTHPPRPPKKAEFAGRPLAPEQQVLPNEAHHPQFVPPQPSPPEGQSTQPPSGDVDTPASPFHQPVVQSMEEQLLELQRRQRLQLQALQSVNTSDTVDSSDSQSVHNVTPPSSDRGPQVQGGRLEQVDSGMLPHGPTQGPPQDFAQGPPQDFTQGPPQGFAQGPPPQDFAQGPPPQGFAEGLPQGFTQSLPNEFVPYNNLSEPIVAQQAGTDQQLGAVRVHIMPQEANSQQISSAMSAADETEFSPQTAHQVWQESVNSLDNRDLTNLQAPLEPVVGFESEVNIETNQAIQDLQNLLQPPVHIETPIDSMAKPPIGQSLGEQPHPPYSCSIPSVASTLGNSASDLLSSRESVHMYVTQPEKGEQSDKVHSNLASPTIPSPLPAPSSGTYQFPQFGESRLPVSDSFGTPPPSSQLPSGGHSEVVVVSPYLPSVSKSGGSNTVTVDSISRPIPAPLLSPVTSPSLNSQGAYISDCLGTPESSNEAPLSNKFRKGSNEPSFSQEHSQPRSSSPDGYAVQGSTYSQQVLQSLDSNSQRQTPPVSISASSDNPTPYHLQSSSEGELLEDQFDNQLTHSKANAEGDSNQSQLTMPPDVKSQSSISETTTAKNTTFKQTSLPNSSSIDTTVVTMNGRQVPTTLSQIQASSLSNDTMVHTPGSYGASLSQFSDHLPSSSFRPIQTFAHPPLPPPAPLNFSTSPSNSPLPNELTMPLQDIHSSSTITSLPSVEITHYEMLLTKQQESLDEMTRESEQQKAQVADQRIQIESYKQQLRLLQQQIGQITALQQKQEQEKTAASGQQAVLMQLLQQQQGMFSQQQAQLESMSKITESHHKQQHETESSYKQALAVEREQKTNFQNQLMQHNVEMVRLQHQLQAHSQQSQTLQLQLQQYHTQIQERDKQLLAFRDQHKQILQNLDQKHQQKVTSLVQQLQEYQTEVKKLRTQRQQSGIPIPLQQTSVQQFAYPSRPGALSPQVSKDKPPVGGYQRLPSNTGQQIPQGYVPGPREQQGNMQARTPSSQAMPVGLPSQPQTFQVSTQPQGLPQPLQPTIVPQGFGQTPQSYQTPGQASQSLSQGFSPSSHDQVPISLGSSAIPPNQQGFQQLPGGQIPTSHQQHPHGFPPLNQTEMNSPSSTLQNQQPVTPAPGQTQFSQMSPGMQAPQQLLGPAQSQQPPQFQPPVTPEGQYHQAQIMRGQDGQQFPPAPQQQHNVIAPWGGMPQQTEFQRKPN